MIVKTIEDADAAIVELTEALDELRQMNVALIENLRVGFETTDDYRLLHFIQEYCYND